MIWQRTPTDVLDAKQLFERPAEPGSSGEAPAPSVGESKEESQDAVPRWQVPLQQDTDAPPHFQSGSTFLTKKLESSADEVVQRTAKDKASEQRGVGETVHADLMRILSLRCLTVSIT